MQLFISYSHKDEWARELQRQIEAQLRHTTFIDKRDIFAGVDWWHEICLNIQKCDSLIFIMSPDSVESPYCIEEVKYAIALNKFIIPLILRKCEIPDFLREKQCIEISDASAQHAIIQIQNSISIYIERKNKYSLPTPLPPIPSVPIGQKPSNKFTRLSQELNDSKINYVNEKSSNILASTIEILHPPFEWITIPAGKVTLVSTGGGYIKKGQKRELELPEYQISKYPITNRQFIQFIDSNGYETRKWWTELGWSEIQRRNITVETIYSNWNYQGKTNEHSEHPVTNISWYEAVAFCLYLSDLTGQNIMLPTEAQWQRAAQGNHNIKYPWGDNWDVERCNNRDTKKDDSFAKGFMVKNSSYTTHVKSYEDSGKSEFGVVDMVGNVWEWCLTDYTTGEDNIERKYHGNYVLKGGSYESDKNRARVVHRHCNETGNSGQHRGFRIVRNL